MYVNTFFLFPDNEMNNTQPLKLRMIQQNPASIIRIKDVFYTIKLQSTDISNNNVKSFPPAQDMVPNIKIKTEPIDDDDNQSDDLKVDANDMNDNVFDDSGIQSETISQIITELEQHGNIIAKEFQISIVPIKLDSLWSNFQFPLKTQNQLELLESFLALNKEFRTEFIRNFSFVVCKTKRSRFGFAYALSEALFERTLLRLYTWTGASRLQRKLEFRRFVEIFQAFHEIVSSKDLMYTEDVTKEFISEILLTSWKKY